MKNFWLDKKEEKRQLDQTVRSRAEQKALWDEVSQVPKRKNILTRYGKKNQAADAARRAKAAMDASKCTKKDCPIHGINAKYLQEAKDCAERWAKTGLLDGIKNKWDRSVTAVLLESQRLLNEVKYNLRVRTKNSLHRHGFNTIEELYSYLDMIIEGSPAARIYYVTFSPTGDDCRPENDQGMVLTVSENTSWNLSDAKILYPKSAGGDWDGYDDHRKQKKAVM